METQVLETHLKKFQLTNTIVGLIVGLATALSVCYGFYYHTNTTLDEHTNKINNIQKTVGTLTDAVNNSAVYQGATKEQIKALENQITDVKKSQERIEDLLIKISSNTNPYFKNK